MISEFLNRGVVLQQLDELRAHVRAHDERAPRSASQVEEDDLLLAELDDAAARERQATSGQPGHDRDDDDRRGDAGAIPLDDVAFLSRDPILSLLQSALDAFHDEPEQSGQVIEESPPDDRRGEAFSPVTRRRLAQPPGLVAVDDRRIFDRFSITDIQWVRSKLAEGIRLFRKRHPFNPNPAQNHELKEHTRLLLVGDWGSGLPRAQAVARQMRVKIDEALAQGRPVCVVHLGDVYYSGWEHEYRKRFLPYWPVRTDEAETIASFCLNANHDMYSGGHGYFRVALADPRFAAWHSDNNRAASSFFSLTNRHWKILGLDTGWEEGGLKDPQASWLADELATAGNRKTLLLSHHQLLSAYERPPEKLTEKISPVLERHPVDAWYWGHEHRCMLYSPRPLVRFGRCVGDGGIPVYQWHEPADPYPIPGVYEHRRFFQRGLERWAVMGFTVLDFVEDAIDARYVDEEGYEHKAEVIR